MRILYRQWRLTDSAILAKALSVWEWDGKSAKPVFAKKIVSGQEDERPQFDGKNIRLPVLDRYKNFFRGSVAGRHLMWTLHVTPKGIENHGEKADVPELDLIDEIFSRIRQSSPTFDLGEPLSMAKLKGILDGAQMNQINQEIQWDLLNFDVEKIKNGSTLRIDIMHTSFAGKASNRTMATLLFTIATNGGKPYVADMQDISK